MEILLLSNSILFWTLPVKSNSPEQKSSLFPPPRGLQPQRTFDSITRLLLIRCSHDSLVYE